MRSYIRRALQQRLAFFRSLRRRRRCRRSYLIQRILLRPAHVTPRRTPKPHDKHYGQPQPHATRNQTPRPSITPYAFSALQIDVHRGTYATPATVSRRITSGYRHSILFRQPPEPVAPNAYPIQCVVPQIIDPMSSPFVTISSLLCRLPVFSTFSPPFQIRSFCS
jgi:hypothetical protein